MATNRICAVQKGIMAGVGQMFGYIYDADGNRVAKGIISSWSCDTASNGFQVTSTYALDLQGQTVTENAYRNGSSSWVHTDLLADGQLMATYDPNGLHFQIADWLGTRRVQTDALGQIEQTCQSLPFGNGQTCTPVAGAAQDATERHFTGKERDTESGLDYFGARYYASNMGRYMSPDWSNAGDPVPWANLEDPQTLNLYAYVQNNPLSRRDRSGHATDPCNGNNNTCVTVTAKPDPPVQTIPFFAFAIGLGHHFIPQQLIKTWDPKSFAARLANQLTTGTLKDKTANYNDLLQRSNNSKVIKIVRDYMQANGKNAGDLVKADFDAIVEKDLYCRWRHRGFQ